MRCSAARRATSITPYASLQPAGKRFEEYRDALCASAERAKALGFKAMKTEITMNGPYAHGGMRESYDRHTEVLAAVRKTIGPDITLMVDVQYLWEDAATCLSVVKDWAEFKLYFLETPIWSDNVHEMAKLVEARAHADRLRRMAGDPLRVRRADGYRQGAGGPARCRPRRRHRRGQDRLRHGQGSAAAPSCRIAGRPASPSRQRRIWPSSPITAPSSNICRRSSATSACAANWPRRSWCCNADGTIPLPTKPGLGVEVDWDVVRRYKVA